MVEQETLNLLVLGSSPSGPIFKTTFNYSTRNLKNNKKIFIIIQKEVVDTIGGTITLFVDYCNLFFKNGYDIYGLFWADKSTKPKGLNENIKYINLKEINIANLNFSNAINYLAKKENPDLFIYFFPQDYAKSKLNKKFDNIPRILMFHGRPDFYFKLQKLLYKICFLAAPY